MQKGGGGRSRQAIGLKESTVKQGFYLEVDSIYRGGIGAAEQTAKNRHRPQLGAVALNKGV